MAWARAQALPPSRELLLLLLLLWLLGQSESQLPPVHPFASQEELPASACEKLTCFADYLQTLMCTWGGGGLPSKAPLIYNLTATWNCGVGGTGLFLLPPGNNSTLTLYTCLVDQTLCFGENTFEVTATEATGQPHGAPKGCRKTFLFKKNIKPQPPFNLTATASLWGYKVSWKTPYHCQPYNLLNGNLHYELRYRKRGHSWQGQKQLLQDSESLWLLPQEFEGDTVYELQVRAQPGGFYQGAWSAWSSPATLNTQPHTSESQGNPGGDSKWLLLLLSLFPALLAILGRRMWKKLDLFVPSPAPFFQSLYGGHEGDFKKWVGIPGTAATLEVFERDPGVRLEAFEDGSFKLLPPSEAECGGAGGPCGQASPLAASPTDPLFASKGDEQEQPYGHLSIDTVVVAGEVVPLPGNCCASWGAEKPQLEKEREWEAEGTRDPNCRTQCKGSSWDGKTPGSGLLAKGFLLASSASWQAGGSLGPPGEGALDFFGPPFLLPPGPLESSPQSPGSPSAPKEETPFYSTLLSLHLVAEEEEEDPENGLDLDTIDSGFSDCDCRSPLDSGCEMKPLGAGEEEKGAFMPSYIKQWVSGHRLKA